MQVIAQGKIQRSMGWIAVAAASVALGAALAWQPVLAWVLLAFFLVFLLLNAPAYVWVYAAVFLAVFSRLITYFGLAPGFVNFLHFPLAIGAAALAMVQSKRPEAQIDRRLRIGFLALGALSLVSWLANGGEIQRPVLTWLLFAEPFLLLYALVRTAKPSTGPTLARLAVGIALIQIPLAFWQFVSLGDPDSVQGTFMGQGAGHHIAGAVSLLGMLLVMGQVFSGSSSVLFVASLGVLLFAVPILSDAKQAVVAFLPAVVFIFLAYRRVRASTLFGVAAVLTISLWGAFFFYKPLRMIADLDLVSQGVMGKLESFRIISQKISESPGQVLIGLGPGNSISRAALAAQEGYVRSVSSGALNLSLSPVTAEILSVTSGNFLFASSSVWSGISSWLGLFGDLGLMGLAIYIWILVSIWQALGRSGSKFGAVSQAALIMAVILGAAFSWLEFPEFMVPWVVFVGLGLVATSNENSADSQPLSASRR
ncbi:MAG: hypothetical protein IIA89_06565 [Chloroflexi bacterium]|nr:hypothetical protein [Chloroflexota bacterium]